jgi:hypothetical protein
LIRTSVVLLVALASVVAARVARPAPHGRARFSAALACGVERWSIKTLKDRPALVRTRPITVGFLAQPRYLPPSRRLPFEHRIFTVIARVTFQAARG